MLLSLLSQKGSVRLARAFVQSSSRRVLAVGGGGAAATTPYFSAKHQQRFQLSSAVEDDIDQALSSFLDDPKKGKKTSELADDLPSRKEAHLDPVKLSDLLEDSEVCL